jgi:recombination protein RecR
MKNVTDLIHFLASFPSIGRRSATKIAIEMCQNKERLMAEFGRQVQNLEKKISCCSLCFNIDVVNPCSICQNTERDRTKVCLIDTVADLWNIEKTGFYNGLYFTINSKQIGTREFDERFSLLEKLLLREDRGSLMEIIIANNSGLDGQTFTFYITDAINAIKEKIQAKFIISSLSKGVPSGSTIEYLDEVTILNAIKDRKIVV